MGSARGWASGRLADVVTLVGGSGFPEDFQGLDQGEIPFFKVSDMNSPGNERHLGTSNNYVGRSLARAQGWRLLPSETVVFAKVGAALLHNRRRLLAQDSLVDNNMMGAVPGDGVDARWLYWWLQTVDFATLAQVGALPSVNQRDLGSLRVEVPPLEEQRRIAEILDTIDETIQATERVIAKLSIMKTGMIHDLLPAGCLAHEVRDRTLPRGWRYATLEELAINHDGRRIPIRSEDRLSRQGPFRYYGASGVIDYVDDYLFDGDFVLLGEDGENVLARSTPLAFVVTGQFWVNNHAHVFEARAGVRPDFLARLLERTDFAGIVSGSAQPKITQSGLDQMRFPVSDSDVQDAVCGRLGAIETRIESERRFAAGLRAERLGLAADLLSGRVRTVAA